jgi:hypothetical protein
MEAKYYYAHELNGKKTREYEDIFSFTQSFNVTYNQLSYSADSGATMLRHVLILLFKHYGQKNVINSGSKFKFSTNSYELNAPKKIIFGYHVETKTSNGTKIYQLVNLFQNMDDFLLKNVFFKLENRNLNVFIRLNPDFNEVEGETNDKSDISKKENINKKLLMDIPATVDSMNRDAMVNILSDILAKSSDKKSNQPNLSIGLYSDWGTGKSSFIELLERTIKTNDNQCVVKIDATHCESQENLWGLILRELYFSYFQDVNNPIVRLLRKIGITTKLMFSPGLFFVYISSFLFILIVTINSIPNIIKTNEIVKLAGIYGIYFITAFSAFKKVESRIVNFTNKNLNSF